MADQDRELEFHLALSEALDIGLDLEDVRVANDGREWGEHRRLQVVRKDELVDALVRLATLQRKIRRSQLALQRDMPSILTLCPGTVYRVGNELEVDGTYLLVRIVHDLDLGLDGVAEVIHFILGFGTNNDITPALCLALDVLDGVIRTELGVLDTHLQVGADALVPFPGDIDVSAHLMHRLADVCVEGRRDVNRKNEFEWPHIGTRRNLELLTGALVKTEEGGVVIVEVDSLGVRDGAAIIAGSMRLGPLHVLITCITRANKLRYL